MLIIFQVLYPINYVRNVAIRATKTPFYIMIDVDFAAQPSLYPSILSYVRQLKHNEKKVRCVRVCASVCMCVHVCMCMLAVE